MTTSTTPTAPPVEAALPELPEPRIVSYQTDSTMRTTELSTYDASDMRAYAREAIAAAAQSVGGEAVVSVWMVRNRHTGAIWWDEVCVWPLEAEAADCAEDMNEHIEGADFEAFCLQAATPKNYPAHVMCAPIGPRWREVGQRLLANDDHVCEFRAVVESALTEHAPPASVPVEKLRELAEQWRKEASDIRSNASNLSDPRPAKREAEKIESRAGELESLIQQESGNG